MNGKGNIIVLLAFISVGVIMSQAVNTQAKTTEDVSINQTNRVAMVDDLEQQRLDNFSLDSEVGEIYRQKLVHHLEVQEVKDRVVWGLTWA